MPAVGEGNHCLGHGGLARRGRCGVCRRGGRWRGRLVGRFLLPAPVLVLLSLLLFPGECRLSLPNRPFLRLSLGSCSLLPLPRLLLGLLVGGSPAPLRLVPALLHALPDSCDCLQIERSSWIKSHH